MAKTQSSSIRLLMVLLGLGLVGCRGIHSLRGNSGTGISMAVSPNGRYILIGCGDQTMHIWDRDREQRGELGEPSSPATRLDLVVEPVSGPGAVGVLVGHTHFDHAVIGDCALRAGRSGRCGLARKGGRSDRGRGGSPSPQRGREGS